MLKKQRRDLVRELRDMGIRGEKVLKAIENVPRELFLPDELKRFAYKNAPLAIGQGQTISQPYMVALMTELLEIRLDHRVLEVGTGSGYQAAILDNLGCKVFSIERVEELYRKAKERLEKLGYGVKVFLQDGYEGLKNQAPFDRIIVTASAPELPRELEAQLNREDGILVVPVGGEWEIQQLIRVIYRNSKRTEELGIYCRFVPMKKGLKKN